MRRLNLCVLQTSVLIRTQQYVVFMTHVGLAENVHMIWVICRLPEESHEEEALFYLHSGCSPRISGGRSLHPCVSAAPLRNTLVSVSY